MKEFLKIFLSLLCGLVIVIGTFVGGLYLVKLIPRPTVFICDKWEDIYYVTYVGWVNDTKSLGTSNLEEALKMAVGNPITKHNECTQNHYD